MGVTRPLTHAQRTMLRCSGHDPKDGNGFGVPLRNAGNWATARSLAKRDLGWIEGGMPNGSLLEGLFFANPDGIAAVAPEIENGDEA